MKTVEMNTEIISKLIKDMNRKAKNTIRIMEVCGTHTHQIAKLGLKSLLSEQIQLISGPGCPICVTNEDFIDAAISLLRNNSVTIATFGDLMRVSGSEENLLDMKSLGYHILVIHSPLEIIKLSEQNKEQIFVLLAVGFETTAPVIALTIKTVAERGINNLFFLTSLKLMSPILHYILDQKSNKIDGFICPGHVASIKGSNYFRFIYQKPAVVAGFEALDIVSGIHFLVKEITARENRFENLYKRCVSENGNNIANLLMEDVFDSDDEIWRGIGRVENSSLIINRKYDFLDARKVYNIDLEIKYRKKTNCQCSDILLGNKKPTECKLFSNICNPKTPHGPCMVSAEGACSIVYKFMVGVS